MDSKKTYNLYCDESTHLQNDQMPFMLISYIKCAYPQIRQHREHFKFLKSKHKFKGEMKWAKISKSSRSRSSSPSRKDRADRF